ncbi:MAG: asparagine synthase (glutamine-hydrolyzing) [Chitinophagales bacterium]|nr:asparagine synthase (glutamine-hydrolyzing) [Chitinophagales bacterium]
MCRIAGVLNKASDSVLADTIAMRDSMAHGGPDDSGIYHDADASLALGHRRLSIIDLSEGGHQPMLNASGDIVIAFNGEIYNYKELKADLVAKGYQFKSASDTEVILAGYEYWGATCFSRLVGMFALAIYDKRQSVLMLARDQQGIKPLYYSNSNNRLYFASEVRAFKALPYNWQESDTWKSYMLVYGFIPEPYTTLADVKMLPKGSYMRIDANTLQSSLVEYSKDEYTPTITTEKEAVNAIRQWLDKAVDRHLISDAPIGLFLSGGIDSSLLTLIAKQTGHNDLHTLSIVFDDAAYSEAAYQQLIVDRVEAQHKSYNLSKEEYINALPDIFKAMDQPSIDGVNSYFICKFAKEYGLKAVLSGLGADELFGGYASFGREKVVSSLKKIPSGLLAASRYMKKDKYRKLAYLADGHITNEYLFHRGLFSIREAAEILDSDIKSVADTVQNIALADGVDALPYGNKVSYMEKNIYMQSQLLKDTDVMSMWHSIEVRVPFLDTDLVKIVNSISPEVKYSGAIPKQLLVKAYDDILPRQIWDRKKQGFVFPFQNWIEGSEYTCFKYVDDKIKNRYQSGTINWTRYWAYLVANNFNYLHS